MERLVLFGGGASAEYIYDAYKNRYDIVAVIDNFKFGEFRNGCPFITIDRYKKVLQGVKILVTSVTHAKEMEVALLECGIRDFIIPDEAYIDKTVVYDSDISHDGWPSYLKYLCDKKGTKVLEIGSRVQTGANYRKLFQHAEYVGFDYYEGENVDVVGDAHCLTSYFSTKFDLIFSSAVFEHLAMPWQVALEIIRLLNNDGYVFIETHYSFSSHERPWHFFQFSENALNVLFPEKFGMKCCKKGCSNLLRGTQFSDISSEYLRGKYVGGMYCHSEFLGKKLFSVPDEELKWECLSLNDVVGATRYPKHL